MDVFKLEHLKSTGKDQAGIPGHSAVWPQLQEARWPAGIAPWMSLLLDRYSHAWGV